MSATKGMSATKECPQLRNVQNKGMSATKEFPQQRNVRNTRILNMKVLFGKSQW